MSVENGIIAADIAAMVLRKSFPRPLGDEARVVADGAHDGVALVAVAALAEVSAQVTVGLARSDDGLDGGAASEFASDLTMDAALLPGPKTMATRWRQLATILQGFLIAAEHEHV